MRSECCRGMVVKESIKMTSTIEELTQENSWDRNYFRIIVVHPTIPLFGFALKRAGYHCPNSRIAPPTPSFPYMQVSAVVNTTSSAPAEP